jgi:Asp-tRNA(Asn)/Glu-tRNA(Gln) amidotransferase A subunit family amidase
MALGIALRSDRPVGLMLTRPRFAEDGIFATAAALAAAFGTGPPFAASGASC